MRNIFQKFFQLEAASGIVLLFAAIIALIWANSPLDYLHHKFIDASLFWINDGLMVVFFLLVGLELKRGLLAGQLTNFASALLPGIAAIGGMIIPALFYIVINCQSPETLRGWATPVATDIAFALGVLSLFGSRVPSALKLFLLALAIFDDIGAIIIITLFYSHGLSYVLLGIALIMVICLFLLNYYAVQTLSIYFILGVLLWLCLLPSGVHPTIAGIIIAFAIPNGNNNEEYSPLNRLENNLHPWVAYLIMPLFALANAGLSFKGISTEILLSKVVLGITAGLFLGKQLGIMGFTWLLVKLRFAKLPEETKWLAFYGVSLICGIGFTMALFLGTLSFQNENIYLAEVRLGVIIGSFLSGLAGALVLLVAFARKLNNH